MRFFLLAFVLIAISSRSQIVLIKNTTIVDVRCGKLISKKDVLIEKNKIKAIGNGLKEVPGSTVINGEGKYLIPGLWDMHAHAFTDRKCEWLFPLLIANGITGIRELGTRVSFDSIRLIRKEILEGKIIGPRIGATTQRILGGTTSQPSITVESAEQARELVRTYKREGVDYMKVYNWLSREAYLAVADEAKKEHMPVAGHVPFALSAWEVSDLGQVSIEHNRDIFFSCSTEESKCRQEVRSLSPAEQIPARLQPIELKAMKTYDENKATELFKRFIKNGTWVCPTLVVYTRLPIKDDEMKADNRLGYIPASFRQQWNDLMKQRRGRVILTDEEGQIFFQKHIAIVGAMHRAGVGILAGSDMMNPFLYPGFSLHDELALMVQAGISPLEALQTTTINPAKFLHKEKEFGTVEKGKYADLVLLDANPLANISNASKINTVIANGRVFLRSDLDKLLGDVHNLATTR